MMGSEEASPCSNSRRASGAGAVEFDGLCVSGPAREEKVGGLALPAEAAGETFGAFQQVQCRDAAVQRPHAHHRGELLQRGQFEFRQTRRPGDLRGRP